MPKFSGRSAGETNSVPQMEPKPIVISWGGIVIAAGCYPIVMGAFFFGSLFFTDEIPFNSEMIFSAIFYVLVGSLLGVVYGMVMSIPAYLLLRVFGWIAGGAISGRGTSGVFGGLTGFLASTSGSLFVFGHEWTMYPMKVTTFMGTTALVAIVMGYFGAIGAGYRYRFDGFPFYDSPFTTSIQFSIGSMLKLTMLIAVSTVIFKVAGPMGLSLAIAWAGYGVLQLLLMLCDHWCGGWRKPDLQKI